MKEIIGDVLKKFFPSAYRKFIHHKKGRYRYHFTKDQYPDAFFNRDIIPEATQSKITDAVFCFWTGENEMSANRKSGLKSLEQKAKVPVILITPKNLKDFLIEDAPLHPAFVYLSLVHRSDYLRCYFMHHHGGGYADVKTFHHSWINAFSNLKKKKDKFIIGYPEVGGIAPVGGQLEKDLKFHLPLLIGNGAYICRSNTKFTAEWYHELHRRMDEYQPLLEKHHNGEIADYPVPYTFLLGQIFHPLSLKYHKNLLQDKNLMPDFKNYH